LSSNKILYILSHPIQYQTPLLQKLAQQTDIELMVFYLTSHTIGGFDAQFGSKVKWDIPLLEGYSFKFIKNYSFKPKVSGKFFGLINFGILSAIKKERPDVVVVHGWAYFTLWFIFLFRWRFRAQLWMRSESPLNQEVIKSKKVLLLKSILLKTFVFKNINKFLYIGSQNKAFYKYYGISEEQLIFTPYAVDNQWFREQHAKLAPSVNTLKDKLNITEGNKVILNVGKYIPKKRQMDIIEAFIKLNDPELTLILLGEGYLRKQMETRIKSTHLKDNIILTGFINQSEISKYYAMADVFVLSSSVGETWGLVVNEALNFGLPIIVSDTPGSAYDLVDPGKNGYIFKTGNTNDLMNKINNVIKNKKIHPPNNISFSKVNMFSIDVIVNNIIKSLDFNS